MRKKLSNFVRFVDSENMLLIIILFMAFISIALLFDWIGNDWYLLNYKAGV